MATITAIVDSTYVGTDTGHNGPHGPLQQCEAIMTDITIRAPDGGSFTGYLAVPKGGSGPGIVVAQEIFGVNAVMRAVCDALASQGYAALCPDIFWRIEPGIQLTDKTEADWQRAFELFNLFDVDKGVGDLQAGLPRLRRRAGR